MISKMLLTIVMLSIIVDAPITTQILFEGSQSGISVTGMASFSNNELNSIYITLSIDSETSEAGLGLKSVQMNLLSELGNWALINRTLQSYLNQSIYGVSLAGGITLPPELSGKYECSGILQLNIYTEDARLFRFDFDVEFGFGIQPSEQTTSGLISQQEQVAGFDLLDLRGSKVILALMGLPFFFLAPIIVSIFQFVLSNSVKRIKLKRIST